MLVVLLSVEAMLNLYNRYHVSLYSELRGRSFDGLFLRRFERLIMQVGDRAALHTMKRSSGLDLSDPSIQPAWEALQAGDGGNWMLMQNHPDKKNAIALLGTGTGGLTELMEQLREDDVMYGICQYTADGRPRQFFLSYIGEEVSGMKRARVSMHRSAVYNNFDGLVGDVAASDRSDLAEASISATLAALARGATIAFPASSSGASDSATTASASAGESVPTEASEKVVLPPGWTSAVDPESGHTYYISESGESQWEAPQA